MSAKAGFSPYLTTISAICSDPALDAGGVYLVGGSVRDAALGRPSHDLDFVIERQALKLARKVADALGGAYFTMDEDFQVGRVVLTPEAAPRQVLDFAQVQGESLEADLRNRDFTVNAMALSVSALDDLIDPLGGMADLLHGRLQVCSPTAFEKDPVRAIRAVRMSAAYGLAITPETRALIPAGVEKLTAVSAERRRDEFLKCLAAPRPSRSLRVLDRLGILDVLIPEMADLKGVEQSPPHIYDVWEHSIHTVEAQESVLRLLEANYQHDNEDGGDLFSGMVSQQLGRYRTRITEHLATQLVPDRPYLPILFLAALTHDFTKPRHRTVEAGGRIRFIGHEASAAEQIKRRGAEMKLSSAEINRLSRVIGGHQRPHHLVMSGLPPSKRAIFRYWRDLGEAGVDVCLLTLADTRALYGYALTKAALERHLAVVRSLLEAYWEMPEVVSPPSLLDGNDLMAEFSLQPGPQIGELLTALQEAQAEGEVADRDQALAFITATLADA